MMRLRTAAKSLFAWLNGLGALLLGFALVNPDARALFSGAIDSVPEPWRTFVGVLVSLGWFALVRDAQRREIKKAAASD
jgi:hypothetical protein